MSVATVDTTPAWATAIASVVGGDAAMRRFAAELLSGAGIAPHGSLHDGALIVVLAAGRDSQRVHQVRALVEENPGVRVIAVMSPDARNATLRKALLAGARGIVLESDLLHALVPTAHAVLAGQLVVPSSLTRQLAPRPLSYREKEILSLVVLGLTNREIARRLFLAESTVKTHLSSAFRKIDARSRAEAVARLQDPEVGYGMALLAPADSADAPIA